MKISKLTENIVNIWNAHDSIHMVSGPGQGKSHTVENVWPDLISKATGEKTICVTIHGTTVDAPDIRGFAIPVKQEGGGTPKTVYAVPPFIDIIERHMAEAGATQLILFLDEFAQSDHLVQKAEAPLVNEGRLGDVMLDDIIGKGKWLVVMASNRGADKSGVNKALGHIVNRIATYEMEPDAAGLVKFISDSKRSPLFSALVEALPGLVFRDVSKDTKHLVGTPFPSPRSITRVFDFLQREAGYDSKGNPNLELNCDEFSIERAAGYIGAGAASELFAFTKVIDELPTIHEVLADPMKAKVPPATRMDATYAACAMLVHYAEVGEGGNMDKLWKYAMRLAPDFQVSVAKQLIDRTKGTLLNDPAMSTWLSNNHALIMSSIS